MIGHEPRKTGLAGTLLGVFAALWVALAGVPLAPNGTPAPAGSASSAQQPADPVSSARQPAGPASSSQQPAGSSSSSGPNSAARETGGPLPARRQQSGQRAADRSAGGRTDWLRAAVVRHFVADAGAAPVLLAAGTAPTLSSVGSVRLAAGHQVRLPRVVAAAHRARAPPPAA